VWCPNANFGSLPGRLSTPIPAAIATPLGRFLTTQPNRSVANGDWDRCVCEHIASLGIAQVEKIQTLHRTAVIIP